MPTVVCACPFLYIQYYIQAMNAICLIKRSVRIVIPALILLLCSPAVSWSHPHMFIDSQVTLVIDSEGTQGFRVQWLFDQFFTAQILLDYDRDRNGRFDRREVEEIKNGAFNNLVHYNYFTTIHHAGNNHRVSEVRDFNAFIENERLGYTFFIPFPLSLPQEGKDQEFLISIFDDTFFCDIASLKDKPVRVESPSQIKVEWGIRKNKNSPILYNQEGGTVQRSGTDYTGTIFPEEIHFRLERKGS
jgi:ABC-type uncharacterized transport system substrate-binding protein